MPVESDDDRLSFLSVDEFGAEATYTLVAGGSTPGIVGLFDNPTIAVASEEGVGVLDRRPTFMCQSADLPAGVRGGDVGDKLTLAGTQYRVLELQPDGTGMVVIILGLA